MASRKRESLWKDPIAILAIVAFGLAGLALLRPSFAAPPAPPTAIVTSPADGSVLNIGDAVTFSGTVTPLKKGTSYYFRTSCNQTGSNANWVWYSELQPGETQTIGGKPIHHGLDGIAEGAWDTTKPAQCIVKLIVSERGKISTIGYSWYTVNAKQ